MQRILSLAALTICLFSSREVSPSPHPYHDDAGKINWRYSLAAALREANQTGRPVLLEICKVDHNNSKRLAETTLREGRIAMLANRYFVPVVVESKMAVALKGLTKKVGGGEPFLIVLTGRGQYLEGLSGYRRAADVQVMLLKVLEGPYYKMPEKTEKKLDPLLASLNKSLDAKDHAKAAVIFRNILKLPGYSTKKDTAYELLDLAQSSIQTRYLNVVNHVHKREFVQARKVLEEVLKDKEHAALPLAKEAKDYLAAVKLMEGADRYLDKKTASGRAYAVKRLDQVVQRYSSTPLAYLAWQKRKQILQSK